MPLFWISQPEWEWLIAAVHRIDQRTKREEVQLMDFQTELQNLTNEVNADTDADNAGATALNKLAALIAANQNDPAALADLSAKLAAGRTALAAAIANTDPNKPPPVITP